MVMAPQAPRRRTRRRWYLRCLLGRHAPVTGRLRFAGESWSVYADYCQRCLRLYDARAGQG